jgi:hypothetical protein
MYSEPMQFRDLAPVVGGTPTRALVRQAKAAGTLIERRPHAEPGCSARRHAVFQTVAAEQPLPIYGHTSADANPYLTASGMLRIGPEDIS